MARDHTLGPQRHGNSGTTGKQSPRRTSTPLPPAIRGQPWTPRHCALPPPSGGSRGLRAGLPPPPSDLAHGPSICQWPWGILGRRCCSQPCSRGSCAPRPSSVPWAKPQLPPAPTITGVVTHDVCQVSPLSSSTESLLSTNCH